MKKAKRTDKCELPQCGKFFTIDNPGYVRGPIKVDGEMGDYCICKECNDTWDRRMKQLRETREKEGVTVHALAQSISFEELDKRKSKEKLLG